MVGGGEGNPLSLGDSDTRRRGQTTSRRGLWSEEEKREKWKRRFFLRRTRREMEVQRDTDIACTVRTAHVTSTTYACKGRQTAFDDVYL